MPIYTVEHNGKTFDIEGPAGATPDQLYAAISAGQPASLQSGMDQARQQLGAQRQAADMSGAPAAPSGLAQGMRDSFNGPAQMLYNALPSGITQAGDKLNNWLADKGAPLARIPEGGMNQFVADQEKQYQQGRSAAGENGVDWNRVGGNILSPVNLAAALKLPQVAALGRVGNGMVGGTLFGATQPVTNGGKDYWSDVGTNAAVGTAAGAALPIATGAVARVVSPNTRESVKTLLAEGVTPTAGQILGGGFQRTEDKLTSIPLVGDLINNARGKSLDEFNRAAYARVLKPIEGEMPKEVGYEGVTAVRAQLTKAYDDLLPKLTFKPDAQFNSELANLQSMAQSLAPKEAEKFNSILSQHLSKVSPNGGMTGETFKTVESALNNDIKKFSASTDAYQQELGGALKEALNVFRGGLERSNPQFADDLAKVNAAYAQYSRLRGAAGMQGTEAGRFTPAQLSAAVRAGDQSVGKGNFAQGQALMQDLSAAGKDALASKYPDSGTAGRASLGILGVGGSSVVNPTAAAAAAAASLPYVGPGRQLAAMLLARRPGAAKPVADAISASSRTLLPGGVSLANLLTNQR